MNSGDAANIPQPHFGDLYDAFVYGAREAAGNPGVGPSFFDRAADAYCKMWHMEHDPEGFQRFHFNQACKDPTMRLENPVPLELPAPRVEYVVYGLYRDLYGVGKWKVHTAGCSMQRAISEAEDILAAADDPLALWVDCRIVEVTTRYRPVQINDNGSGVEDDENYRHAAADVRASPTESAQ